MNKKATARFERLSAFATVSRHDKTLGITPDVIRSKSLEARANSRKREILVLHRGDDDPLQRMLNAIEPGSYVQPHRHCNPPKSETIVLMSGSIAFLTFHDDGSPDTGNFIVLHPAKGALALDAREGIWHTFFALEPNTVLFEVKAGPFDPRCEKEAAPWAPAESSPDAPAYLAWMERLIRLKE